MAEAEKLVFMGTPVFAAIVLEKLLAWPKGKVEAVYCQPDKPAGRGMKTVFSPVKKIALERELKVCQPATLRAPEAQAELAALEPDFIIVAAYGLILPQAVLDIAPCINVHASLLPRYRGAAPIQRAIMEGATPDAKTGVSIMRMTAGLDEGPVYAQAELPISGRDSAAMQAALAALGSDLLVETLDRIIGQGLQPVEQDDRQATYAHKLRKEEGWIDWNRPVAEVDAMIRGLTPWPGAQTTWEIGGKSHTLTLLPGCPGSEKADAPAGALRRDHKKLRVACADGWYELVKVRPQGRGEMTAADFANGLRAPATGIVGQPAGKA